MFFQPKSAGHCCFLWTLSISCPDHVIAPQRAYRPFEVSRSASQQSLKVILHPTSEVGRLSAGGGGACCTSRCTFHPPSGFTSEGSVQKTLASKKYIHFGQPYFLWSTYMPRLPGKLFKHIVELIFRVWEFFGNADVFFRKFKIYKHFLI